MTETPKVCNAHFAMRELKCQKGCGDICIVVEPEKVNATLIATQKELERVTVERDNVKGARDRSHSLYIRADGELHRVKQALALRGEPVAWLCFHSRNEPQLYVQLEKPNLVKSFDTDVVWEKPLYAAAVSGERVREACAKACEALEKKYNDIQSDPNCIVPDYVTADLKEEAIRECIQAIRALPLAAPPEGK